MRHEIASCPDPEFKVWVIHEFVPPLKENGEIGKLICGGPGDLEMILAKVPLLSKQGQKKFGFGELLRYIMINRKFPERTYFCLTKRRKKILAKAIFCWKLGRELLAEIQLESQQLTGKSFNLQQLIERPSFRDYLHSIIPIVSLVCSLAERSSDDRQQTFARQTQERFAFLMEACSSFGLIKEDPIQLFSSSINEIQKIA